MLVIGITQIQIDVLIADGLLGDNILMPETWFTSDCHFGHKNILEYEKLARPFDTLEEMHETLINNWNSVVADGDIIYHLGDVAFGKYYLSLVSRLKGKKRLILGNHDTYSSREYLMYFDKLYGVKFWERCVLSHMPVHPCQLGSRWLLNVHGHLHSKKVKREIFDVVNIETDEGEFQVRTPFTSDFVFDENYFNVSVEQNNLTPINADIIRERYKELNE